MKVALCIDDKNGMMFNRRRQSRDRVLLQQILDLAGTGILRMSPYSSKLFTDAGPARILAEEDFLEKAQDDDLCFVEDRDLMPFEEKIDQIILFRWNRIYPADTFLTLDLGRYTLEKTEDFKGNSHENITKEIYRR